MTHVDMTALAESLRDDYPRRYCSACDKVVSRDFGPGPNGRPNAKCPKCGSLERHRFLAILLSVLAPALGELDVVLDVAPSRQTSPLLARLGPRTHVRLDLGADNRRVDVLGSLTETPLRDGSVDLLVCYHVLEHIPDDRAAIGEIARVLSARGHGLLQVPFKPDALTDEDPDAPVEVRLERFGQADHVRYYGADFEDRLVQGGLAIKRVTPRSLIGEAMAVWLNLSPDEVVWLVRRRADATVPPADEAVPTSLSRAVDAMLTEMVTLRGELVRHRREARSARRELNRQRGDRSTVKPLLRRVARRLRRGRDGRPS